MKKIGFGILLLLFISLQSTFSQDLLLGNKIWYSSYIYYKLSNKLSLDAYILNSFDAFDHSFSFNQNDLSLNYKLDSKQSIYVGYTQSFYKWQLFYDKYGKTISSLKTISFNRIFTGYKYRLNIFPQLRLRNNIGIQYYLSQLEKYQLRFSYKGKLYWYNKNWPMKLKPFTQISLYYYQNGIPVIYYDNQGNIASFKSPNGLHRYRLKFGVNLKPVKKVKQLGITVYYAIQQEFNLKGFGNDLNVIRPGNTNDIVYSFTPSSYGVKYPFNNFNVLGFQLNFIFL